MQIEPNIGPNIFKKFNSFEDTPVWRESHHATIEIYKATKEFPQNEEFGLVSQIRRSASSIGANIAEGFFRNTTKELVNFLFIARGSCGETINHIILAKDLEIISNEKYLNLRQLYENIAMQLNGWIKSLKKSSKR